MWICQCWSPTRDELLSSVFDWPPTSCLPSATISSAGTPVAARVPFKTNELDDKLDFSAAGTTVDAPSSAETDEPMMSVIPHSRHFRRYLDGRLQKTSINISSLISSTLSTDMAVTFNANSIAIRLRTWKQCGKRGIRVIWRPTCQVFGTSLARHGSNRPLA